MKNRIKKFNAIVGNEPVGFEDREKFWKQVQLQAKLVLDEAKELYDGAMNRDIIEVVDGTVDVWYLNEYVDDILVSVGVDVNKAKDMVCTNNDLKYTESLVFAVGSMASYDECYFEEVEYEDGKYYTVKRKEDGKVMKLMDHVSPEIIKCIPSSTMKYLGE